MSNPTPSARFPWAALVVVFVLALIGVVLLAYMVFIIVQAPPAGAPATATRAGSGAATQSEAATSVIVIPTTTLAPPATETPVPTLVSTETPAVEASPTQALVLNIVQPANVRAGPGLTYPILGGIQNGGTAVLLGRDTSATWFAVQFDAAPDGMGWVSNLVATYSGDVNGLPVVEFSGSPPPPPPPGVTATTAPAAAATAPPAATNTPAVSSARGIVANYFRVRNTTAAVNEDVWFEFQVTNTSASDVPYGALAAHTDVGYTAQSWTSETLRAGQVLTWDDHINIGQSGTYQVYLGICFSSKEACLSGGAAWERLSSSVTVTIQ
jgi:hypothetical protein